MNRVVIGNPTPRDALERALDVAIITSTHKNGPTGRPGQIIERLNSETRALLRELRSDDIQDVRVEDTKTWYYP